MRITKKINNNAVLCIDDAGRSLVAFGRGIGFREINSEIPLSVVNRTFYDIDDQRLQLIAELSPDVLSAATEIADMARRELPYELVRNIELTLADHIAFAIERINRRIDIRMPLEVEIEQNYPLEYNLGKQACKLVQKQMDIALPPNEAIGIAMCLINGAYGSSEGTAAAGSYRDESMLESITSEIEGRFGITIDRTSFEYTRFKTHVYYLFKRIRQGATPDAANDAMYDAMCSKLPQCAACVNAICSRLERQWTCDVDRGERLFLLLHVNRILQGKAAQ